MHIIRFLSFGAQNPWVQNLCLSNVRCWVRQSVPRYRIQLMRTEIEIEIEMVKTEVALVLETGSVRTAGSIGFKFYDNRKCAA